MYLAFKVFLILFGVLFNTFSYAKNSNNDNVFLQRLTVKDGLSQGTINVVFQDKEGFLWIGTEDGLNIYDGYRFRVLPGESGNLVNNGVYKVLQDNDSIMWLIASDGLFSYDKLTDQYHHILTHPPEDKSYYFVDFVEGNENILWVASNKTLLKLDRKSSKYKTFLNLSTELAEGETIYEIKKQGKYLYIATRVGIFLVDSQSGQWKKLPSINQKALVKNPKLDKIYNVHITKGGYLFLGTFEGLFKVNINKIESFMNSDSLLPDYELVDKNMISWTFLPTGNDLFIGNTRLHNAPKPMAKPPISVNLMTLDFLSSILVKYRVNSKPSSIFTMAGRVLRNPSGSKLTPRIVYI